MPNLPTERRKLTVEDERKLWRFVYNKTIKEKSPIPLRKIIAEFIKLGHIRDFGLEEVEFHFHKEMVPYLYKSDELSPVEILQFYRHFKVPISKELKKFLSHLCNASILLHYTSNQIKSWSINRRTPTPSATPKRSSEVPRHVEIAMWKHLCANANRINNGFQANSLKFWREMKMSKEDEENVSLTTMLMFFHTHIRRLIFALRIAPRDKMKLIQELRLKPSATQKLWMMRYDSLYIETNKEGHVSSFINWKLDKAFHLRLFPKAPSFESYEPLKLYGIVVEPESPIDLSKVKTDAYGIFRVPDYDDSGNEPEGFNEFKKWLKKNDAEELDKIENKKRPNDCLYAVPRRDGVDAPRRNAPRAASPPPAAEKSRKSTRKSSSNSGKNRGKLTGNAAKRVKVEDPEDNSDISDAEDDMDLDAEIPSKSAGRPSKSNKKQPKKAEIPSKSARKPRKPTPLETIIAEAGISSTHTIVATKPTGKPGISTSNAPESAPKSAFLMPEFIDSGEYSDVEMEVEIGGDESGDDDVFVDAFEEIPGGELCPPSPIVPSSNDTYVDVESVTSDEEDEELRRRLPSIDLSSAEEPLEINPQELTVISSVVEKTTVEKKKMVNNKRKMNTSNVIRIEIPPNFDENFNDKDIPSTSGPPPAKKRAPKAPRHSTPLTESNKSVGKQAAPSQKVIKKSDAKSEASGGHKDPEGDDVDDEEKKKVEEKRNGQEEAPTFVRFRLPSALEERLREIREAPKASVIYPYGAGRLRICSADAKFAGPAVYTIPSAAQNLQTEIDSIGYGPPLVIEKTLSDSDDIIRYYNCLEKLPIYFEDDGMVFERNGPTVKMTLINKTKQQIKHERGGNETSRGASKQLRMSSARRYTPPPPTTSS